MFKFWITHSDELPGPTWQYYTFSMNPFYTAYDEVNLMTNSLQLNRYMKIIPSVYVYIEQRFDINHTAAIQHIWNLKYHLERVITYPLSKYIFIFKAMIKTADIPSHTLSPTVIVISSGWCRVVTPLFPYTPHYRVSSAPISIVACPLLNNCSFTASLRPVNLYNWPSNERFSLKANKAKKPSHTAKECTRYNRTASHIVEDTWSHRVDKFGDIP